MDIEKITQWLQKLILVEHHELNNWEIIINRRTEVAPNIFKYKCNINHNVYLNNHDEPVNYKEQHIIDGNIYYDYNNAINGAGTYTLIYKWR